MIDKVKTRLRRAKKGRAQARRLMVPRLSVHRTPRHIYAQVIMPDGKVVAAASSVEAEVKSKAKTTGNVEMAKEIGSLIAKRAKQAKVTNVAFDRSGFKYHGRIKALADAAREAGLEF